MKKLKLGMVAVAVSLLVGCGGAPTLEEKMQGSWGVKRPGDFDCVNGLTLENGRYVGQILCSLMRGGFGTEMEVGSYTLEGNALTMGFSEQTSCPPHDHSAVTATLSVEGDILTFAFSGGVLVMKRAPASPSQGAVLSTGCWDDTGGFTPFPLQRL